MKTSVTKEVGHAILAAIRRVHSDAQALVLAALEDPVEPQRGLNLSGALEGQPGTTSNSMPNKKLNVKGKGKNKTKQGGNAPKELQDKQHSQPGGERFCWNFNLELRQDAEPRRRCPRGHHRCAEPHCQQANS